MLVNKARFTIDGSPSEDPTTGDRGVDVIAGQTIAITLEQNPARVLSVEFSLPNDDDEDSPYQSLNETPQLFDENGESVITSTNVNATFHVTIDAATEMSSYVIRCKTVDDQGTHIFERMISVRTADLRMTVPAERAEYNARGWSDSINQMALAIAGLVAGGAGLLVGGIPALGNVPTWNGSAAVWAAPSALPSMATDKLLGRDTAGSGAPEEIGLDTTLEFTGAQVIRRAALTGDVTAAAGSNTLAIAAQAVTFSKFQNISTAKLLGRFTALSGSVEEVGLNATLAFDGAGNLQRAALTGAITAAAGSNVTTLSAGTVTLSSFAPMATDRLLGRDTAGSGSPEELTVGGNLEFTATGGIQRGALTGDVTAAAGSGVTAIAAGVIVDADVNAAAAIALTKLATIATDRLLGRDTAGTGAIEQLTVGGNLEFTGTGIQRGALTGDVTAAAGSGVTAIAAGVIVDADVNAAAGIAFTKLATIATDRLLGRDTAGTGALEALTVSGGLEWTGTGIQRSALTGAITAPAGSNVTTLAAGSVTLASLAPMATDRLLGRDTAGSGSPEEISLDTTLEFSGTLVLRRAALTGAISAAAGSNTTAYASGNFGALNLTTTGFVGLGTNPASVGMLRLPNAGDGIQFRNAANTVNLPGLASTGADAIVLGSTAGSGLSLGTTNGFTIAGVSVVSMSSSLLSVPAGAVAVGTNPASVGAWRAPNATYAYWRNAANSGDILGIGVDANDDVIVGGSADSGIVIDASGDTITFYTGGSARFTINNTTASYTGIGINATFLSVGTNPAASGGLRMPNNVGINWRNAANSGDIQGIVIDASDRLVLGDGTDTYLRVDAAANDVRVVLVGATQLIVGTALVDAGAALVRTTGSFRAGSTPATTGLFNVPNASTALAGRNVANSADLVMLAIASDDTISLGNIAGTGIRLTTAGVHGFRIGGVDELTITSTTINAQSNDIITTGNVSIGATPSTTGLVRISNNTGIYARNAANSANIALLRSDSADGVLLGDLTTTVALGLYTSSARLVIGSSVEIQNASQFRFDSAVAAPIIYQEDDATASATGETFIFQAQNATGTTATGGMMDIRSGTGTSAAGRMRLRIGTTAFLDYPGNVVPATTGLFRPHHNSVVLAGRNNANTLDYNLIRWGVVANDTLTIGDAAAAISFTGLTVTLGDTADTWVQTNNAANTVTVGANGAIQAVFGATQVDFQDNNLLTSGALVIGTNSAATGAIRWPQNIVGIAGRNNANAADVNLLSWGTSGVDIFTIGQGGVQANLLGSIVTIGNTADVWMQTVDSTNTITFGAGGSTQLTLNATQANFQDNDIITTGTLSVGTNPATLGHVRISNGAGASDGIQFRNAANSANLLGLAFSSGNTLVLGAAAGIGYLQNQAGVHSWVIAGATTASLESDVLQFGSTMVSVLFSDAAVGDANIGFLPLATGFATGKALILSGQDMSGSGATGGIMRLDGGASTLGTGGALDIRSGSGTTSGNVTVRVGATTFLFASAGTYPTTGMLRSPHGLTTIAGITSGASNVNLFRWGTPTTDELYIGDTTYTTRLYGNAVHVGNALDTYMSIDGSANRINFGVSGTQSMSAGAFGIEFGAIPATSGALRFSASPTINARNNGNTDNLTIARTDASDIFYFGDNTSSVIFLGSSRFTLGTSSLELGVANFRFDSAVVLPVINHETDATAGVTGDLFTIQAQDVTGIGSTGAKMILRAGNSTGGSGTRTGGELELASGTGGTVAGLLTMKVGAVNVYQAATTGVTYDSFTSTYHRFRLNSVELFAVTTSALTTSTGGLVIGTSTSTNYAITWTSPGTSQSNIGLMIGIGGAPNYNSGSKVLFLAQNVAVPSANPTAGAYLWIADNASDGKFGLVARASDGTTRIGNLGTNDVELAATISGTNGVAVRAGGFYITHSPTNPKTAPSAVFTSTGGTTLGFAVDSVAYLDYQRLDFNGETHITGNTFLEGSNLDVYGNVGFGGGLGVISLSTSSAPLANPSAGAILYMHVSKQGFTARSMNGNVWEMSAGANYGHNFYTPTCSTSATAGIITIATEALADLPSTCSGSFVVHLSAKNAGGQLGTSRIEALFVKAGGTLTIGSVATLNAIGTIALQNSGTSLLVRVTPTAGDLRSYTCLVEVTWSAVP